MIILYLYSTWTLPSSLIRLDGDDIKLKKAKLTVPVPTFKSRASKSETESDEISRKRKGIILQLQYLDLLQRSKKA